MENTFVERLQAALDQRQMSQSQLATALEVSRSTITGWLRYGKLPDAYLIRRLCLALDCSADWLLGLEKNHEKQDVTGKVRWIEAVPPYLTDLQREQISYGVQVINQIMREQRHDHPHQGRLAVQAALRAGAIRITRVARHTALETQLRAKYPILKDVIVSDVPSYIEDTIIRTELVTFLAATDCLSGIIRPGGVGLGSGYTMLRFCEQSIPTIDQFSGTRWIPLLAFQPDNMTDYTANYLARLMSTRHPGSQALYLPHPDEAMPEVEQVTRRAMQNAQVIFASVSGVDRREQGRSHLLAEFRSADYHAEAPHLRAAYADLPDKKQFGAELLRYLLDSEGHILSGDAAVGSQVDLEILRYNAQVIGRVGLIAAQGYKTRAIATCLRAGLANMLVIDAEIAGEILQRTD